MRIAAALLLCCVAPLLSGAGTQSSPPTNFEGIWHTEADSLKAAQKTLRRKARPLRRRRNKSAEPGSYPKLHLPEKTLRIRQTEERMEMQYDAGKTRVLFLDGRGSTIDSNNQEAFFAGWEGPDLIVETTDNRNTRIIETLHMGSNGLMIRYEVQNPKLARPFHLLVLLHREAGGGPP